MKEVVSTRPLIIQKNVEKYGFDRRRSGTRDVGKGTTTPPVMTVASFKAIKPDCARSENLESSHNDYLSLE